VTEARKIASSVYSRSLAVNGRQSASPMSPAVTLAITCYERNRIDEARLLLANRQQALCSASPLFMLWAALCETRIELLQKSPEAALAVLERQSSFFSRPPTRSSARLHSCRTGADSCPPWATCQAQAKAPASWPPCAASWVARWLLCRNPDPHGDLARTPQPCLRGPGDRFGIAVGSQRPRHATRPRPHDGGQWGLSSPRACKRPAANARRWQSSPASCG
jgi:hypothetical protein